MRFRMYELQKHSFSRIAVALTSGPSENDHPKGPIMIYAYVQITVTDTASFAAYAEKPGQLWPNTGQSLRP